MIPPAGWAGNRTRSRAVARQRCAGARSVAATAAPRIRWSGDVGGVPVPHGGQVGARDPAVECAHRRAAPDLVVGHAGPGSPRCSSPRTGPGTSGRSAPSRASGCPAARAIWSGSRCGEVAHAVVPDLVRAGAGTCAPPGASRSAAGIVVDARRSAGRSRAAACARAANIVPRRSTCTSTPISNMSAAGAMSQSATLAAASSSLAAARLVRLDAGLVDRTGHHVGGAQRERGEHRRRAADAARRADPDRSGVAQFPLDLVAQRDDLRHQHRQRPPVGVAAGVGLGGDVVGHRHVPGADRPARP